MARRGQHQDAVAGHGGDSGNAATGGARAAAARQGVSGKARAALSRLRRAHRRGDVRGGAVLDGPQATHIAGTLFLYEDRLRIVAGRFESLHRRRNKGDPPAPLPEHRAAKIAAVHGKRAKLYEKRQQVLNLGPDALALLTEIIHREPKLASRRVEELYELLESHDDDTMREAIGRAVRAGTLTVAGVKRALSTLGARRRDGSAIAP